MPKLTVRVTLEREIAFFETQEIIFEFDPADPATDIEEAALAAYNDQGLPDDWGDKDDASNDYGQPYLEFGPQAGYTILDLATGAETTIDPCAALWTPEPTA